MLINCCRYDALLTRVASVRKSSLLVGGPGTAKTTIINMFIAKFPVEEVANKVITFSSLTTPGIFQTTMEAAVEKRQGRTFGPPGGKKMTVFIDDISMPYINEWGDQVRALAWPGSKLRAAVKTPFTPVVEPGR